MKTAELSPNAQKIDRLIKRIDEGDIKIPAFQRGYVWKQNQVIDLLESVVNEYPIGSILLWKSSEHLKATRNIAGYTLPVRDDTYPVNYVLDGQQRLASIYGVFSELIEQEKSDYSPEAGIFEIFYNFENDQFVPHSELSSTFNTIQLRNLLNVSRLISALQNIDHKYHDKAQALTSQFLNYEIPVVTISNRDKKDVGIIFERINNTGTRLTPLDLMTAWTWTEDFHLVEAANELLEELEEKGFGTIKPNVILQIASAIIQDSTISSDVLKLSGEAVRDNWKNVEEALRKSVDFLSTDLNCRNIDFFPFSQQLIGIAKFFATIKRPTSEQLNTLKNWFWRTAFSDRYSSGQTTLKINDDISFIKSIADNDFGRLAHYESTIDERVLQNTKFSIANPLTRAYLLLLAQQSPKDLVKAQRVDLDLALSTYNRKEYHHVFPAAFLKTKSVPQDKVFNLLNFCFLPSDSNKQISKKAPSDYFFNVIDQQHFTEILSTNLLPLDRSIYRNDNYDLFLQERANLLIEQLHILSQPKKTTPVS